MFDSLVTGKVYIHPSSRIVNQSYKRLSILRFWVSLMGFCCLSSCIHWRKRSKISAYPKHQQLWSSEFLEDHPSAPEVTAELSNRRSADAATTISSPNDFIMMWRDPKNLVAIMRTEWIEGPEETFHRDKWFGRQSLLYYQVEKMVDLLQSPKGIDFSVSMAFFQNHYVFRVTNLLG